MRMIARLLLAAILASITMIPAALAEKVDITFLLTSDIYNFDATKDGRGGFARLNAIVKSERAKGGHLIYVHAGDMISPSLLSGIDKGGDGYNMFKSASMLVDAMGAKLLASAVIDYITAKKEVAPVIEGRIRFKM